MKLSPILLIILFTAILSAHSASFTTASNDVTITASTPSTSTGGSFIRLYACVKDSNEANAYCGGFTSYAVKLTLNPIAYAAEIESSTGNCRSSALYEPDGGSGTSLAFFNDGSLKYTSTSSFSSFSDVTVSGTVTVNENGRFAVDNTNKIIYVADATASSGTSKVYKITNLDATPTVTESTAITVSGDGDSTPTDLILANNALYVSLSMSIGRVARIINPSTSSAAYSKTVSLTGSNVALSSYACLAKLDNNNNHIFVITKDFGVIAKLSIGNDDDDFALVSTSAAIDGSTTIGSVTWLTVPSSSFLFVIGFAASKIYVFDVSTMTYQTTSFTAPTDSYGGVLLTSSSNNNNNKFAVTATTAGTLYHYEYTLPASSASSISCSLVRILLSIMSILAIMSLL